MTRALDSAIGLTIALVLTIELESGEVDEKLLLLKP
jgi:hypothetical protein